LKKNRYYGLQGLNIQQATDDEIKKGKDPVITAVLRSLKSKAGETPAK